MKDYVLILLRDGTSFGCCGPIDLHEAYSMKRDGTLDSYDYWKIVDYRALLHSVSKKYVIADKDDLVEAERNHKKVP